MARTREFLKMIVKQNLERADLTLSRGSSLRATSRKANELGATVLLDIGANTGQYATLMRRAGFDGRIVSYEPMREPAEETTRASRSDPRWTVVRAAMGSAPGSAVINVAGNSYSSSILPMIDRHVREAPESQTVGHEDVEVRTVEMELARLGVAPSSVMLKADTQGFEMAVLEGCGASLNQFRILQLELSLVRLYQDAPHFDDVYLWLREKGWRLWLVEPGFRGADGEMLQVDGVFVRDDFERGGLSSG